MPLINKFSVRWDRALSNLIELKMSLLIGEGITQSIL